MLSRSRKQGILEKLAAKTEAKPAPKREITPSSSESLSKPKAQKSPYGRIASGWDYAKKNPGKTISHSSSETDIVEGARRMEKQTASVRRKDERTGVQRFTGNVQAHLKRTGLIPKLPGGA